MLVEDLDQVMDIEEALFSVPWTREGFLTYLMKKDTMFFVVEEKDQILGYCSMMTVLDEGVGIRDVEQAMEPMFTTCPEDGRSGMGFSFMEAFMDRVEVVSAPGKGTSVTMKKKIGR